MVSLTITSNQVSDMDRMHSFLFFIRNSIAKYQIVRYNVFYVKIRKVCI